MQQFNPNKPMASLQTALRSLPEVVFNCADIFDISQFVDNVLSGLRQVYLTDMDATAGGATAFRDLGPLRVRPKKGKCLMFFPSFGGEAGAPLDGRVLHAGEVVGKGSKEKYIAQFWCHKKPYPPSVPEGSSHEAAQQPIAEYIRRFVEVDATLAVDKE